MEIGGRNGTWLRVGEWWTERENEDIDVCI